jgi:hypothetical protein
MTLPLLGGMGAVVLTLFVVPVLHSWGEELRIGRRSRSDPTPARLDPAVVEAGE